MTIPMDGSPDPDWQRVAIETDTRLEREQRKNRQLESDLTDLRFQLRTLEQQLDEKTARILDLEQGQSTEVRLIDEDHES